MPSENLTADERAVLVRLPGDWHSRFVAGFVTGAAPAFTVALALLSLR